MLRIDIQRSDMQKIVTQKVDITEIDIQNLDIHLLKTKLYRLFTDLSDKDFYLNRSLMPFYKSKKEHQDLLFNTKDAQEFSIILYSFLNIANELVGKSILPSLERAGLTAASMASVLTASSRPEDANCITVLARLLLLENKPLILAASSRVFRLPAEIAAARTRMAFCAWKTKWEAEDAGISSAASLIKSKP